MSCITYIYFILMSCLDRLGTDSISRKIKKLPTVTFYFLWKPRCWCKKYYQTDGLFVHLCESSTSTYQHSSMDIIQKYLLAIKTSKRFNKLGTVEYKELPYEPFLVASKIQISNKRSVVYPCLDPLSGKRAECKS